MLFFSELKLLKSQTNIICFSGIMQHTFKNSFYARQQSIQFVK